MSLLVDITKRLGKFELKLAFEMELETLALFGASGCGKSVSLRCIAGILTPDAGRIVLNGQTLFDSARRINLRPQERRIGYLFQHYALFPNMTVEHNIACVMQDKAQASERTAELLKRFQLENVRRQRPAQLSGGQQQRAALARILACEPQALLLDEPFSALDSYLKMQLEQELRETIESFGGPVVWVSHDRDEVFRNCDQVCVVEAGSSRPAVTPHELFVNPRTVSTAQLSGCKNIVAVSPTKGAVIVDSWGLKLECAQAVESDVTAIGLRAHHLYFAQAGATNAMACRLVRSLDNVFSTIVIVRPEGAQAQAPNLSLEIAKEKLPQLQERMFVAIAPENILLLK